MSLLLHPAIPKFRRYIYRALALLDGVLPWRQQTVIFAYHGIGRDQWRFGVAFDDFSTQIEYLLTTGFRPVTLEAIYGAIEKGERLPGKTFAVTFDDGYQDILLVRHFLEKRGIRPAVFVIAESEAADRSELGTNRRFLSSYEIRELQAAGWEIGCHSATHADFSKLDAAALEREIAMAKSVLEAKIGFTVRYFAYPKGFHSEVIRAAVKRAGYRGALSMDDGFIGPETDLYALPRVGVDRTHTAEEFATTFLRTVTVFRLIVKSLLHHLQSIGHQAHEVKRAAVFGRIRNQAARSISRL